MCGCITPLPHTPSWHIAELIKEGQLYLLLTVMSNITQLIASAFIV
jgi:hypothetical protein